MLAAIKQMISLTAQCTPWLQMAFLLMKPVRVKSSNSYLFKMSIRFDLGLFKRAWVNLIRRTSLWHAYIKKEYYKLKNIMCSSNL